MSDHDLIVITCMFVVIILGMIAFLLALCAGSLKRIEAETVEIHYTLKIGRQQ